MSTRLPDRAQPLSLETCERALGKVGPIAMAGLVAGGATVAVLGLLALGPALLLSWIRR